MKKALFIIVCFVSVIICISNCNTSKFNSTDITSPISTEDKKIILDSFSNIWNAQYSYYVFVEKREKFASSIKNLGFVHKDNGCITNRNVYLADYGTESTKRLAQDKYSLRVLPLSKNGNKILGYSVFAIPRDNKYPVLFYYIDKDVSNPLEYINTVSYLVNNADDIERFNNIVKKEDSIDVTSLEAIANSSNVEKFKGFKILMEE